MLSDLQAEDDSPGRKLLCHVLWQAFKDARLLASYATKPQLTKHERKRRTQILKAGDPVEWLCGDGGRRVCRLLDLNHGLVRRALDDFLRGP